MANHAVISARVSTEYLAWFDACRGGRGREAVVIEAIDRYMQHDALTAERDTLKAALLVAQNIERDDKARIAELTERGKAKGAKPAKNITLSFSCMEVLHVLRMRSSTSFEVGNSIGESTNNVARRLKDLYILGKIQPTGEYRKGKRYMLTVWAAV